jgi:membrane protease YdiL (CAAX protease family)
MYYFALALGWSWFFWILAILLGLSFETPMGVVLGLIGLLGPMVAGIGSTYLTHGKEGRRDYWLRVIDVRRIGARWYAVIFLFVPVLIALAVGFDLLSGGRGAAWEEPAVRFFASPWTIIPFAFSIFLIGPMEEFGWRGYVLDRLQGRWNALEASLILGIVWSLWHLPLFFFQGSYQYNLGAWSPSFWLFMIGIVPLNVLFTWVFNNTLRSTLAAMLFHFMVNFTGELVALTPRAELYSILLWIVVAIVVTAIWGARTLMHQENTIPPLYPERYARGYRQMTQQVGTDLPHLEKRKY